MRGSGLPVTSGPVLAAGQPHRLYFTCVPMKERESEMSTQTDPQQLTALVDEEIDGPLQKDLDYLRDIARFRTLLTGGHISQAQSLLKELETKWPRSEQVRRAARIFTPSVARIVQNGRRAPSKDQVQKERAWLREHAKTYPGCWVVLDGDRLLGWHPNLRMAVEEAEHNAGPGNGSLHHIPYSAVEG